MILLYHLPQARKPGREIIDSYEPRISDACGHSCTSKDCQLGPEFHSNPLIIVLNISSKYQNFNEIDFHKFSVESVWWCVNCNIPNVLSWDERVAKHWSILWSEEPWNQRMLLRPSFCNQWTSFNRPSSSTPSGLRISGQNWIPWCYKQEKKVLISTTILLVDIDLTQTSKDLPLIYKARTQA